MADDIKLPPRPEPDGFLTISIIGRDVEVNAYRGSTMDEYARAAVEADRAQRKPLTDEQIVACLVESSCVGTVKMSYDVGPYEITKLSVNAEQLTRAIEAAHGIPAPKGGSS